MKFKPEKNSGLKWNRTQDLCDTGAMLNQLIELLNQLGAGHFASSAVAIGVRAGGGRGGRGGGAAAEIV